MFNAFSKSCINNSSQCLACGSYKTQRTILDLGSQPLANDYHDGKILDEYPLALNLCTSCYHLQLSHCVNPDLMFKNYLYVSGTTQTLRDYFDYFAKMTIEHVPNAKKVLDIASNDATQLDSYKNLGLDTYGIDPAENLYYDAVAKGHKVICDYFNTDTVKKFGDNTFDIITAQNVFAHTRFTYDFLQACSKILKPKGKLFIQTSQANMVMNNEFDTIYHEHLSFFNINSMMALVNRAGLHLIDVMKTDIHGTSYVFVISHENSQSDNLKAMYQQEKDNGLYDILKYPDYAAKCYTAAFSLKKKLEELKEEGYIIVGYGAAAKGNTLLNFTKIQLDCIIDDNPLKQGLLTPGMNIPIYGPSYIASIEETAKVAFVPLAWNFFNEICKRIKKERDNSNDLYIKYFPEYSVKNSNG
jgi:2-polyprenyl-3-methyl-5-hydroxy-6-metoxy-1,4-benzoquinol methylase